MRVKDLKDGDVLIIIMRTGWAVLPRIYPGGRLVYEIPAKARRHGGLAIKRFWARVTTVSVANKTMTLEISDPIRERPPGQIVLPFQTIDVCKKFNPGTVMPRKYEQPWRHGQRDGSGTAEAVDLFNLE